MAHSLGNLSECSGVGRRGMLRVLGRGTNIAHSEGQFRTQYVQEFQGCAKPMPALNAGCIATASGPGSNAAARASAIVEGWQFPDNLALEQGVADAERQLRALRERQRQAAEKGATAVLLRASADEAELTVQRLRERQRHLGTSTEHLLQAHEDLWQREPLRRRILAVRVRALQDALALPNAPRRDVQRRLRALQQTAIEDSAYATPYAQLYSWTMLLYLQFCQGLPIDPRW